MRKINYIILALLVIFGLSLNSSLVQAESAFPDFPMSFYGVAKLDGAVLPSGTEILVYNDNILLASISVGENGIYAYNDLFKQRLLIGEYSGELSFKYKLTNSTEQTGTSPVKYTVGFSAGAIVSFNLLFVTTNDNSSSNTPSGGGGGGGSSSNSSSGGGGGGSSSSSSSGSSNSSSEEAVTLQVKALVGSTEEVIVLGVEYDASQDVEVIIEQTLNKEKEALSNIDEKLSQRIAGRILLQVEEHGEAWYIYPRDYKKYYMANGEKAYEIMRFLGIGITNQDLERVMSDKEFAKKHSGKIFLQVEAHGEAYYIDTEGGAHYLQNGEAAYEIMRNLGLGITNENLRKIEVGEIQG